MAPPTQRDFEETLQAPPNTLRRQRVTVGTNLRGIELAPWDATQYDVTIETKRRRERRQQPGAENVPPGEAPVAAPATTALVPAAREISENRRQRNMKIVKAFAARYLDPRGMRWCYDSESRFVVVGKGGDDATFECDALGKTWAVTLRAVGTTKSLLPPNNDPALINIALRNAIEGSRLGFVASAGGGGSTKYLREGSERALTAGPASGCALRTGVQFSIDSVGSRLFLAVDAAACFELAVGARENDDVASYLIRLLHLDPRNPRLRPEHYDTAKRILKEKIVEVMHRPEPSLQALLANKGAVAPKVYETVTLERKTVFGLPADEQTFTKRDGTTLTVAEYFAQRYSPLTYPGLPVIVVRRPAFKNGEVLRNEAGKIVHDETYFPPEVCRIPGRQRAQGVNDPDAMLCALSKPPDAMFRDINALVDSTRITREDGMLRSFGVKVMGPTAVEADVLRPPGVFYRDPARNCYVNAGADSREAGTWRAPNRVTAIDQGKRIDTWLIVDLSRNGREVDQGRPSRNLWPWLTEFAAGLCSSGGARGRAVEDVAANRGGPPNIIFARARNLEAVFKDRRVTDNFPDKPPDLVTCVIDKTLKGVKSASTRDVYQQNKALCDSRGILSTHVDVRTLTKRNSATMYAEKVAWKNGGEPRAVVAGPDRAARTLRELPRSFSPLVTGDTMVVGVGVSRPDSYASEEDKPVLVAVSYRNAMLTDPIDEFSIIGGRNEERGAVAKLCSRLAQRFLEAKGELPTIVEAVRPFRRCATPEEALAQPGDEERSAARFYVHASSGDAARLEAADGSGPFWAPRSSFAPVALNVDDERCCELLRLFGQARALDLFVWRSGASEQEAKLEPDEIEACLRERLNLQVSLTFIAMRKSSVIFFPLQGNPTDSSGNCPAGTCVSHSIVKENQFLLKPHCGVRGGGSRPSGTTRPLLFDVLRNDAHGGREVPLHELDQFTNDLSYLYPPAKRATKFLSLCKFAQEKAVRVRKWLAQGLRADELPKQIARMTVC